MMSRWMFLCGTVNGKLSVEALMPNKWFKKDFLVLDSVSIIGIHFESVHMRIVDELDWRWRDQIRRQKGVKQNCLVVWIDFIF